MVLISFVALIFITLRIEALFRADPKLATLEGREVLQYMQIELKSWNHAAVRSGKVQALPADVRKRVDLPPETVLDEGTED